MTTSNALFTTLSTATPTSSILQLPTLLRSAGGRDQSREKIALCGRLASTFALLRPMLLEPILSTYRDGGWNRVAGLRWFLPLLWERAGVRASYRTCFIFINRTLIMNNRKNYASQRRHAHYLRPKGASLSAHCPGVLPVHALKTSMNALTLL